MNSVATIMEIVMPPTEILSTTGVHIRDHCPLHLSVVDNSPKIDTIMIIIIVLEDLQRETNMNGMQLE